MDEVNSEVLFKKGAEASLFLGNWHGKRVVIKRRLSKKYRPDKLDLAIRTYRTVHEPQLMHEAKVAGVPTPAVFMVDVQTSTIIMEFIEGYQVKRALDGFSQSERHKVCFKIGSLIGKLHLHDLIHGDLTTSNMILTSYSNVFFLDFGLGEKSSELEARGVDLHLLKRALESTHFKVAEECFQSVLQGYREVVGAVAAEELLEKIREIERRGRYVTERKNS
ncbi:MAG: Kae1-associated kinase Bud32 [Candidatus Bathyarchaeota archaeon]|nr:Kae1-associated kinase Bud32 [Candidatus Bathyarchaeota archaeon]